MALRDHPTGDGGIGWYHKNVGENDTYGFFAISGVAHVPPNSTDATGEMIRCDSALPYDAISYGPYGFHRWNGSDAVCSCGRTDPPDPQMGHHQIAVRALSRVNILMEALPYGYVLYFEMHDPALEEECVQMSHSDCARTLQELMRLMVEWDYAYSMLGNRELIAETCHGMLEVLDMPQGVKDFLLSEMPDEKVARFIRGNPDAQQRVDPTEVPDMSNELSDWLEQKILSSRPLGSYRQ